MPEQTEAPELEQRITAAVEAQMERLRADLFRRLRAAGVALEEEGEEREETGPILSAEEAEEEEEEAPPAPATTTLLQRAIRALDRAHSQDEILRALVEESRAFASRSALFLTRSDGVSGWISSGFPLEDEAMRRLAVSLDTTPWEHFASADGALALDEEAVASMSGLLGLEEESGEDGYLVPLVLQDRLAAALYAQGQGPDGDSGPDLPALQLLAYTAALALETLPFRERETTPTLRQADGKPGSAALPLWSPPPAEEPAPDEAPEEADAPLETVEGHAPEVLEVEAPPAVEEAPPPEPGEPAEASADVWTLEEDLGEPEVAHAEGEELSTEEEQAAAEPGTGREPETGEIDEESASFRDVLEAEPEEDLDDTRSAFGGEAAEETGPRALGPAAPRSREDIRVRPEVAPPADMEGPGLAFSEGREPPPEVEDPQHQEARRLARLLVSEIKLYNEEQVEAGRRSGDVYQRLREDIDRSRRMYEERIDASVRRHSDYFQEELVHILCGGDPEVLGS